MSRKSGKRSRGRGPWFYPAIGAAVLLVGAAVAAWALSFDPFAPPRAPEGGTSLAAKAPRTAPRQAAPRTSPAAPPATDENKTAGEAEAAADDSVQGNDVALDNEAAAAAGPAEAGAATDRNISTLDLDTPPQPRARENGGGVDLWVLLPIVLASLLGGLVGAWWFCGRLRWEVDAVLRPLVDRIDRLEKFQRDATVEINRLDALPGSGPTPPPVQPSWMRGDRAGSTPSAHEPEIAPPPRAPLNLEAIAAQYNQLVQGNISRSAFDAFFGRFGSAAPADIVDNGRFIQSSAHEDSLLTSVTQGRQALVFPSYAFIANSETQFTTMASAPGAIQHLFELSKGGGGLLLDRPASFEDRGLGLQLVRKGALRGFQG